MHITYKQPQLVEVSAALHNGTSDYHSVVLGRRTPVQGHDRETVSELGDRPVLNITKKPDNTSDITRQYFQFGDFQPLCSHHHVTGKQQQTELQDLK
ncbi:uncharacterized protein LOC119187756 isoform X3 [Rhipicephalus microplus]|uniref:uncharacterized protein LOC119187756 isoform X3 n=1 Tax=Rhipicephalus microplus TaxID=6941 RepID=UPI003F6AD918